jgi:hypothetical protein
MQTALKSTQILRGTLAIIPGYASGQIQMFTKGTPRIQHQTTKIISKQLPNSKSSSVRTGMESLALQISIQ